MHSILKAGLAAGLVLSVSACQTVGDSLSGVNNALGALNSALGGKPGQGGAVYVPPDVKQATYAAFTPAPDPQLSRMLTQAKPQIVDMVDLVACGATAQRVAQYAAPDTQQAYFSTPFGAINYHTAGCLTPVRITGYQKRAANAFLFTVYYVSPQSQEGARETYTAVQQPDGEWLFRW
jgi:hypothetical protein